MDTISVFTTRIYLSRYTRIVLVLAILFGYTGIGLAAGGTLDITFGTASSGVVYTDINVGSTDEVQALALHADGRIIATGSSDTDVAITRYTTTGVLDSTFSSDGKTTLNIGGVADVAYAVVIQDNDKILIAGATNDGVNDHIFVARYNSNGNLDTSFGTNGLVVTIVSMGGNDLAHALALQPDGKILVAGEINGDFAVLRYDINGTLDTSFGGGDGITTSDFFGSPDRALAIALLNDGKILLAGEIDNGLSNDFALARYNTDGSLDIAFGVNGLVNTDFGGQTNDFAFGIALQGDGKIVLGGYRSGADDDFALARYGSDGSLDATFGSNGLVTSHLTANNDQAYGISIQGTGRIVLAGVTNSGAPTNEDLLVARYTITGTLDTSFGTSGSTFTDIGPQLPAGGNTADLGLALALQSDNKILVGGSTDYPLATGDLNFFVARYDSPNTTPTIMDVSKAGIEDNPVSFAPTDFSDQFSDLDGDFLRKIQVLSLPANGTLTLSSVPVVLNQEILVNDISSLVFNPQADFNGSTSFSWNGSDGLSYAATTASVNITLVAVNDPPTFTQGGVVVSDEDAGPQIVPAWATNISPGADNENDQVLTFMIASDNPGLFAAGPSIDSLTGDLSYSAATNAYGSANMLVRLSDDGGTANGGLDTSNMEAFTITINPVNDQPSFTPGADVTVDEDSGLQSISNWATAISAGPTNESTQSITFTLETDQPALFSALPAVDALDGTLSFTPAANMYGTALITVTLQDDGGTLNGGLDTSSPHLLTITIQPVNDVPTLSNFSLQGYMNLALPFEASDFEASFLDIDGDLLSSVRIAWLPAGGQLILIDTPVTIGQEIPVGEVHNLRFVPATGWTGNTVFGWNGSDGQVFATSDASVSIDISPTAPAMLYLPLVIQAP